MAEWGGLYVVKYADMAITFRIDDWLMSISFLPAELLSTSHESHLCQKSILRPACEKVKVLKIVFLAIHLVRPLSKVT